MLRSKLCLLSCLVFSLALGGAACGKDKKKRPTKSTTSAPAGDPGASAAAGQQADAPKPGGQQGAAPVAAGTAVIQGSVKLTGTAPEMPVLKRDSDPVCAKNQVKAELVVANANGTLRNVLVRIKPGTVKGPMPTKPVEIAQQDCLFVPRVQGAVTDQEISILNGDATTHNVHGFEIGDGSEESLFNLAQPKGAPEITKDANGYQLMKFKCDVHPWMMAYVVVSDHPYFAVTGDDGSFKIEGVPAGKYTLEAWHEHYGVKTTEIEVADGATAAAAFTYAAADKPL